jgi:hypothetical protein
MLPYKILARAAIGKEGHSRQRTFRRVRIQVRAEPVRSVKSSFAWSVAAELIAVLPNGVAVAFGSDCAIGVQDRASIRETEIRFANAAALHRTIC